MCFLPTALCKAIAGKARDSDIIRRRIAVLMLFALCCVTGRSFADITVTDDTGVPVSLKAPAQRIISLSPHITELLYSIGAGDALVGAVEYSDFPRAAQAIPRIGRHNALDMERIFSLRPDLVIAWQSGNPKHQVEQLRQLGLTVYYSEPRHLTSIADSLRQLGILTGRRAESEATAQAFLQRYQQLQHRFKQAEQHAKPVTIFYQTWNPPLMTLNGEHLVNEIIELCGGRNIFASLPSLAPTVSKEAVIAADPDMIIATSVETGLPRGLTQWREWPALKAVRLNNLFVIHPDIIHRYTLRILDGVEALCGDVALARSRLN